MMTTTPETSIRAELVSNNHDHQVPDQELQQSLSSDFNVSNDNNNDSNMNGSSSSTSSSSSSSSILDSPVWDLLASCAALFLWLQRSTFGVVGLVRSLVLGHCLRLLVSNYYTNNKNNKSKGVNSNGSTASTPIPSNSHTSSQGVVVGGGNGNGGISEWTQKYFATLQSMLLMEEEKYCHHSHYYHYHHHYNNNSSSSIDWPAPPALVVLGFLTIVALIVHPDGMTWIILGKIRDAMMTVLDTCTAWWDTMVNDYGVIATASASSAVTALLVLILAVVIRKAILSPGCNNSNNNRNSNNNDKSGDVNTTKRRHQASETKKRRKRKGHRGSKVKGTTTSTGPRLPKVEEVSLDGADVHDDEKSNTNSHRSDGDGDESAIPPNEDNDNNHAAMTTPEPNAKEHDPKDSSETNVRNSQTSSSVIMSQEEEGASIATSPSAMESVVSSDETMEAKGLRDSIPSVCTVESAAMSDDISCGSMSVRSGPLPRQQQQLVSRGNAKKGKLTTTTGTSVRTGKAAANTKSNRVQKSNVKGNGTVIPTTAQQENGVTAAGHFASNNFKSNGNEAQFDSNKNFKGQKHIRGGKGRGGNIQTSRGGRGKGGRFPKPPKNQATNNRTQSPFSTPNANNFTFTATPPTSSGATVLSISTTDSSSFYYDNNNRLPPVSPHSQTLFSCEGGNSGWSPPTVPSIAPAASTQQWMPNETTVNSFDSSRNRFRVNSANSVDFNCGLWSAPNDSNLDENNKNLLESSPQRPLRPPPGLAPPPGLIAPVSGATTPLRDTLVLSNTTTPIGTPMSHQQCNNPALVPITSSSISPSHNVYLQQQHPSPSCPWSGDNNNGSRSNGSLNIQSRLKENPFASESDNNHSNKLNGTTNGNGTDDADGRIEAELQELGGRMIGSVLDF